MQSNQLSRTSLFLYAHSSQYESIQSSSQPCNSEEPKSPKSPVRQRFSQVVKNQVSGIKGLAKIPKPPLGGAGSSVLRSRKYIDPQQIRQEPFSSSMKIKLSASQWRDQVYRAIADDSPNQLQALLQQPPSEDSVSIFKEGESLLTTALNSPLKWKALIVLLQNFSSLPDTAASESIVSYINQSFPVTQLVNRFLLHEALWRGHFKAVRFLMDVGAKPNLRVDCGGATALHIAARKLQPTMLTFLCSKGALLDLRDESGDTSLDVLVKTEIHLPKAAWDESNKGPVAQCIESLLTFASRQDLKIDVSVAKKCIQERLKNCKQKLTSLQAQLNNPCVADDVKRRLFEQLKNQKYEVRQLSCYILNEFIKYERNQLGLVSCL